MKNRAVIVLIIVLAFVSTLGCGVVRKACEPIDRAGCKVDCQLEGMDFYGYEYEQNRCDCKGADGNVVALY